MKKGCLVGGGILLVLLAIMVFWGINFNNKVKLQDLAVQKQWSNVENTYQKRMDLIDQTVSTVKGAAEYERETLNEVINARATATSTQINIDEGTDLSPEKIAQFQEAQNQLGGAFSRLIASFERYPDLKAVQNFSSLQATISSMEQEILFERRKYNDQAEIYNRMIVTFPQSIIAGFLNFKEKGFFKATEGSENAPKIDFSK
ncbi:LemA family protein [Moheibacter stercoris]|uniref:LemA protein n=1 Tax=Moheibacter stercoris TaxID=1628251 RepID=A0ABV2LU48_9FLAO